MKRPLSDIRPFGPIVEQSSRHDPAEVNIYFDMKNIAPVVSDHVKNIVEGVTGFTGVRDGIYGTLENVVTLQTTGNTTSQSKLDELEREINKSPKVPNVEDIEIIW